jgi:fructose-bisphosphate aldolase class 1
VLENPQTNKNKSTSSHNISSHILPEKQKGNMMSIEYQRQLEKITHSAGFIAALDQSGGSTPKALRLYGTPDDSYVPGESSMFDAMHEFRGRIMTSPSFNGDRIIAVILFENTMERLVNGIPTPKYLWEEKNIVPIIKVDQGLMPEEDGVQKMKTMTKLDPLLDRAISHNIFGTKMRSFIKKANEKGIQVCRYSFLSNSFLKELTKLPFLTKSGDCRTTIHSS